jgi:hypothetical protein
MKIDKEIKITDIAGERVAIRQGKYGTDMTKVIAFNPTAEWLWSQLANRDLSENDVICLLEEKFGLDKATAAQDARKWIDQCVKAGIIKI